ASLVLPIHAILIFTGWFHHGLRRNPLRDLVPGGEPFSVSRSNNSCPERKIAEADGVASPALVLMLSSAARWLPRYAGDAQPRASVRQVATAWLISTGAPNRKTYAPSLRKRVPRSPHNQSISTRPGCNPRHGSAEWPPP